MADCRRAPTAAGRALPRDLAAARLDLGALALALEPAPLRRERRPGRLAYARRLGDAVDEILQAAQCLRAVHVLAARGLRLDHDDAIGGITTACLRLKSERTAGGK